MLHDNPQPGDSFRRARPDGVLCAGRVLRVADGHVWFEWDRRGRCMSMAEWTPWAAGAKVVRLDAYSPAESTLDFM